MDGSMYIAGATCLHGARMPRVKQGKAKGSGSDFWAHLSVCLTN